MHHPEGNRTASVPDCGFTTINSDYLLFMVKRFSGCVPFLWAVSAAEKLSGTQPSAYRHTDTCWLVKAKAEGNIHFVLIVFTSNPPAWPCFPADIWPEFRFGEFPVRNCSSHLLTASRCFFLNVCFSERSKDRKFLTTDVWSVNEVRSSSGLIAQESLITLTH